MTAQQGPKLTSIGGAPRPPRPRLNIAMSRAAIGSSRPRPPFLNTGRRGPMLRRGRGGGPVPSAASPQKIEVNFGPCGRLLKAARASVAVPSPRSRLLAPPRAGMLAQVLALVFLPRLALACWPRSWPSSSCPAARRLAGPGPRSRLLAQPRDGMLAQVRDAGPDPRS